MDDGRWGPQERVWIPTPTPPPGAAPEQGRWGAIVEPPRIRFSRHEGLHLLAAVLLLAFAFAFVVAEPERHTPMARLQAITPIVALSSLVAVGSGFVLHELAHKVLAQRYGHWAEFRAQLAGLFLSIAVAAGVGILFAAPGAVLIRGPVTPRENGLISVVGPGVNLAIALLLLPFTWVVNPDASFAFVMGVIVRVNAILGIFNLIPIHPLDGRKVWNWNPWAWGSGVAMGIGILVLYYQPW